MRLFIFLMLILHVAVACQNNGSDDQPISGIELYKMRCITCHGMDGAMGNNGAKNLIVSEMPLNDRIKIIRNGKGGVMPAFKNLLTQEEIMAVARYSMQFNPALKSTQ